MPFLDPTSKVSEVAQYLPPCASAYITHVGEAGKSSISF